MRNFFYFSILFVITISCSKKSDSNDYRKIPADSMQMLIKDMHFADAVVNIYNTKNDPVFVGENFYDSIYSKYNIDANDFKFNLAYYINTGEIVNIYDNIITEFNFTKAELEKEKYQKRHRNKSDLKQTSKENK